VALRALAEGRIFAEVTGDGRPRALALHGWARRGSDFGRVLEGLDAIALDLPGFGASPAPAEVIGAAGYAEMIAPILDEFDAPPAVLGHSFGGRVAVCLAANAPTEVGPLVLTGVPLIRSNRPATPAAGYRLLKKLNRFGLISDERLEAEKRRRGSSDYRAATGIMRDILVKVVNESYENELSSLQGPVRLVWGADDGEAPVEVAKAAAAILEASGALAGFSVLDGIGHMTPLEAPDTLREVLLDAMRT
jgi:pimeloyl-ACP methyl ester carboxylesterase